MSKDGIDRSIRRKLASLRGAIRRRLAGEGLASLLLALVGLAFALFALDYLFRPEPGVRLPRLAMLAALAVGLVWVLWRRLIQPLRVPMGERQMALLVEDRYPQLQDRLVSTLELAGRADLEDAGVSRAMVQRVSEQANRLAGPLDFRRIIERRQMRRAGLLAAASVMLFSGFSVWRAELVEPWLLRTFAFAQVDYPQDTYLTVAGGPDFTVVRGRDLTISVRAAGQSTPEYILVHARYPSVGLTEERVDRVPGTRRYEKTFQAVAEEFRFHVTGGDDSRDRRQPHTVRVLEPPTLHEAGFEVHYPPHMNRDEPRRYRGHVDVVPVPIGSTVHFSAECGKDLRAVRVLLDGRPVEEVRRVELERDGGKRPRGLVAVWTMHGNNEAAARTLEVELTDTQGVVNPRGGRYLLQVLPDREPMVEIRKEGIGVSVTPSAVLPLHIGIRDDHGLAGLAVDLFSGGKQSPFATRKIEELTPGRTEFDRICRVDLKGRNLQPGDQLTVQARATDGLPSELGGPNSGLSQRLSFRVVEPTELMEQFVRRQQELRLEFLQTIKSQEEARIKTAGAAQTASLGEVSQDVRRQLKESAILQGTVRSQCAKIADSLWAVLEEMQNNRLGTSQDHAQLADGIIQPMRSLTEPMGQLGAALRGTEQVQAADALAAQARKLAESQLDLRSRMEGIAERMEKLESRQALANELEWIIKVSEELLKQIESQSDQNIGNIFEDPNKP